MPVCSDCKAGCCRRTPVDLTGFDIMNISKTLDFDLSVFIDVLPVKDKEVKLLSLETALFKFTDDECSKYYRFCLKRVPSRIIDDSYKCLFLQEWNDEILDLKTDKIFARCGIYSVRPLICAIYPAKLDTNELIGCIFDPSLHSKKTNNPAYTLCPRQLTKEDFTDYSGEIMKNLALYKFEVSFFISLAKHWNENPKSLKDLTDFLKKVYTNRIVFPELIDCPENV